MTFLHSFTGGTNDAAHLLGSPTSSGDTLFGVARGGGTNNQGVVFSVSTNGADVQILHSFSGSGEDGCCPDGSVVLGGDTLYGTAGFPDNGLIFSVGTNGANFQVLHDLEGGNNDGAEPFQSTSLILVGDTLYGVTLDGGTNNDGVIYSITTNAANFQVLHSFTGGSDGRGPDAPLTPTGDTLFGVTPPAGGADQGVIFAVSTNGTGFQVLHTFTGGADGSFPGPVTVVDSMLFGLTQKGGGSQSNGTLYAINMDGTGFHVLHTVGAIGDDANDTGTGLTLVDGSLYGTSSEGGANGLGTIFSISTNGLGYGIVYSFANGSGNGLFPSPYSSLTLVGTNLFGFTDQGGTSDLGTVFMLDLGAGGSVPPSSSLVTVVFSNVEQTCKDKTKGTSTTTNCTVTADIVITNAGVTNTPAFTVALFVGQGSVFDDGVGPFPSFKKMKALKKGKRPSRKVNRPRSN